VLGRSGRRAESGLVLDAKPASILAFEEFADRLEFLSPRERDRLKLAGGEILDNIVKHASPDLECRIHARAARRGGSILLAFYFRAPSFAAFAAARPGADPPEPLFDPARRRWRGIGLVMCRNLARKLRFRPGEVVDRIYLEFEPD
jgi:anti-sigma regulatory factor (Ser/Thr protein kinase)